MQEDCAAQPRDRRIVVVPGHDDDIVDAVVAPQPFMPSGMGQRDLPVIGGIGRIVAPAIRRRPRGTRQPRSEDRRVGKEGVSPCISRLLPDYYKKKRNTHRPYISLHMTCPTISIHSYR